MRRCVRRLLGLGVAAASVLPAAADFTMGEAIDPTVGGLYRAFYSAGFDNIVNDPYADSLASQFYVSVGISNSIPLNQELTATEVFFTFYNVGDVQSVIAEIYWDWTDPEIFDPFSLTWVGGDGGSSDEWWEFPTEGLAPPNLPGGDSLQPAFGYQDEFNVGVLAGADGQPTSEPKGPGDPGIGVGEYATFRMSFLEGFNIGHLSEDLTGQDGSSVADLRFGLHVRSIPNPDYDPNDLTSEKDFSFSYVSPVGSGGGILAPPTAVPVPGAASLGLLGFGLIAAARRKARK